MPTYKIDLSYDGTAYCGWQIQPNQRSVQSEVNRALKILLPGEDISVQGAGRTDAGVHALQQVAGFQSIAYRSPSQIMKALNSLLPADIICLDAQVMDDDFHPRHCSKEKMYRYRILYGKRRCPFRYKYTWHISTPLDIPKMELAAKEFEGTFDFQAFQAQGCGAASSIRTIRSSQLLVKEDELHFEVVGKGFLRHQVRNMMGAIVAIGQEKMLIDDVAKLLNDNDRKFDGAKAPALGLWLVWTSLLDNSPQVR